MDGITEAHSDQDGSSVAETLETSITYAELKAHVAERRSRELEELHPHRRTNQNARANTTRALVKFMEVNSLGESDVVGPELLGTSAWDQACRRLGSDATAKRRRSEMHNHVRRYAIELIRERNAALDAESFGDRLSRLRQHAGFNIAQLARASTDGHRKVNRQLIQKWEEGQRIPAPSSYFLIVRIAQALGVDAQFLLCALPPIPYQSRSFDTRLDRSVKRRVAKHLPANYDCMNHNEQAEVIDWIIDNILSTPKEVLEDGSVAEARPHDMSIFALGRTTASRSRPAPPHFIEELDNLGAFKSDVMTPVGKNRSYIWSDVSRDKADYILRAFFGALCTGKFPIENVTLSAIIAPKVIDFYVDWRHLRRRGFTRTITMTLEILERLLHPKYGFVSQSRELRERLSEVPDFITRQDLERSRNWAKACRFARAHIAKRIKEVNAAAQKGRDPFEALLPALDAENPRNVYDSICDEIRRRMPDGISPIRRAEALRALMLIRIGLILPMRQKNLRELLVCLPGERPKSFKELKLLKRGQLVFEPNRGWLVRITREAFKNATSRALDDEMELPIPNVNNLYEEMSSYLDARSILLKGAKDPGTFFVKTMQKGSKSATYNNAGYYNVYRAMIVTYGIYNPFTGRGAIRDLKPHGPHSVRHIMATYLVKKTGNYAVAAALLLDTEEMIRNAYARFGPKERFGHAQHEGWGDLLEGAA